MTVPQNESATARTGTKPRTSEEFLTAAALFVEESVYSFLAPPKISFECPGENCRKETTWEKLHDSAPLGSRNEDRIEIPDGAIQSVAYRCGLCGREKFTVIYREIAFVDHEVSALSASTRPMNVNPLPPSGNRLERMEAIPTRKVRVLTTVMKVGQYPAPSLYVPSGLQESLGKDATKLYRKALLSRNSGYGLAAVAYMRRVVEDKTNELIEVAAQYAESNNVTADVIAAIRAAISLDKYTPYEDKLKIAATVFPDNLKVNGINPLDVLFTEVSRGLHGLSEEECVATADAIKIVFEYVFENLKAKVENQQVFAEQMKKLTSKLKPR